MSEWTFTPKIEGADGTVKIDMPQIGYLKMPAEMARKFATAILHGADTAEGKAPTHLFIIPVTDGEQS